MKKKPGRYFGTSRVFGITGGNRRPSSVNADNGNDRVAVFQKYEPGMRENAGRQEFWLFSLNK